MSQLTTSIALHTGDQLSCLGLDLGNGKLDRGRGAMELGWAGGWWVSRVRATILRWYVGGGGATIWWLPVSDD